MAVPTAIACQPGSDGRNWRAECRASRTIHWRRCAPTIQPAGVFTLPAELPDDPPTLQLILRAAVAEIERLRLMIAGLQRNRFGRRSEKLDDAALQHGVEDLEQSVAEQMAGLAAATQLPPETPTPAPDPRDLRDRCWVPTSGPSGSSPTCPCASSRA